MRIHVRQPFKLLGAAGLMLLLGACATSGRYSCKAPDGVACMSTLQVYELTNNTGSVSSTPKTENKGFFRRKTGKVVTHQLGVTGESLSLSAPIQGMPGAFNGSAISLGNTPAALSAHAGSPESVSLVPAQVMRIWFAPTRYASGDLHVRSFVYSEITPRRWSIGGDVRQSASSTFDPDGPWVPDATSNFNP